MRAGWVLVFFAVCALLLVAFQVVKQEINIRGIRKTITFNTNEIKTKEDEILISKDVMQKLSNQLDPLDKQGKQLTAQMEELAKQKENSEKILNTCQTEKADFEQQKSQKASAINELKTNQNVEKQKVEEEVQNLQKQILDRDTKICLYVDKAREEAKALCKDKMPAGNA